ncbi:hypothetical protein HLB44_36240 [Aquincola sp. S2]|uniref:Uncharacterized protein n=1 Tax=Pseudaquabacterium terrae TaxID=2732868 RepID=A0ABX2EVA2_9BURK|nr:hypothetical protein [Aquabacterium terrae]NRF72415.1 hypothetical protein [Aquabacterium terrae]
MDLGKFEWAQVIAVLALVIAATNAYFTFFRKAPLQPRIGETILLQLAEEDRLRVKPEVTFHNPGASLAIVHRLEWELRDLADGSSQNMIWDENLTTTFVDEGGQRRTDTRFESFPGTIYVSKGDAVIKRMQLSTARAIPLKATDYLLSLKILSDGTSSDAVSMNIKLRLTSEDISFLKENQLSPENTRRRILRFNLDQVANGGFYLRKR